MKNKKLINLGMVALFAVSIASCGTSTESTAEAKAKSDKAYQDSMDANNDYLAEIESYRKESAEKIEENNKSIAEFKLRIDKQKAEAKADYVAEINRLEQKNTDIKKKLDDYQGEGKEKWKTFKEEFGRDMENLGNAFRDLTVKNNK